jgi:hypothetical protein
VTQDVLILQAASGRWNPAPIDPPSALVQSLVDRAQVIKHLQRSVDDSLYMHLRAYRLNTLAEKSLKTMVQLGTVDLEMKRPSRLAEKARI